MTQTKATELNWYAVSKRSRFHAAGTDWIRTGVGICGTQIRRPAYTLRDNASRRRAFERTGRDPLTRLCRHCLSSINRSDTATPDRHDR